LGRQKDFENYFVFGCTGAETVPFFIGLQTGQNKRIALLDNDDKGKKVYQKILGDTALKAKCDSGALAVIFVSDENDKVIEDLFKDAVRSTKNKGKLAALMAQDENKTAENFAGFSPLLDKILNSAQN
jgi:hypothetical protein